MHPIVTAFRQVPEAAQGLVRDLRVRWALEEAGERYREWLINLGEEQSAPEYLKLQPFGQVPAFEQDGLLLFESGAIVLHIAERSPELMPDNGKQRALVRTWLFAAINTIEVPIATLLMLDQHKVDRSSVAFQAVLAWTEKRLSQLSTYLGTNQYLVANRFTAADLMMVSVLRMLRTTHLLVKHPTLVDYKERGESRSAFRRALADQMRHFEINAPMLPD